MMKTIAIIGAGLSGLRAALELVRDSDCSVTIYEKSPSVGGRVATRRFDNEYINHGAEKFNDLDRVLESDKMAQDFLTSFNFLSLPATGLAKAMRDQLTKSQKVTFTFGTKVARVTPTGVLILDSSAKFNFDRILITSPLPQTQSILNSLVYPQIIYSKKILFVGKNQNKISRLDMTDEWSETHFELPDHELILAAENDYQQQLKHLDLKKWRYSQVLRGVPIPFGTYSHHIILAGDAFDPLEKYNAASAWLSGKAAAEFIGSNSRGLK